MVIDFKEIPNSHAFENFCMHFLEAKGLETYYTPAIGQDRGRDLISEERSQFGVRGFRWLVSCKHYASSGKSIGVNIDAAEANKLYEHDCNGFIFFFSTAYTEGFRDSVVNVCRNINKEHKIFNSFDIEKELLSSPTFYPLIRQYFPKSYDRLISLQSEKCCQNCGPNMDLYAVYTKNKVDYSVSCDVYGECCISDVLNHFDESGIKYSIYKIRDV